MDELHQRVVMRIRELAAAQQRPLSHLVDEAGLSRSHFWDVMAGRKSPTLGWLGGIAQALRVDVSALFEVPTPPRSSPPPR